ncbi:hypothetical protein LZD49_04095 [Dyadobacter sp. CY261]|uniref:hypothetical protein n=1 Tax=Dyadobacter sp. CY261 TaxID=2907203 RepID=UPI001F3E5A49|nr:hypothetical protein [Dyadobacter sp. CY261]MCF0069639.1 hypothetical protein [Dyadobacter sp. CY261]
MKFKTLFLFTLAMAIALFSFTNQNKIDKCFISFSDATSLTATKPERLPKTSEKTRTVATENGEVEVTRIDGYRVSYNNEKKAQFVSLKVELSAQDSYETDQKRLLDNLKYLNAHSSGMETKELIELQFNGYKIFGLSRGSIETGSTLGTFVMFPGNGVTVYFYFNNVKPELRSFDNIEDYKKQRDRFIEEYTKHLTACSDK